MSKLLRNIIKILDGTPAVYGKRQRGQSLLEMAFLTPLLFMLFAGIVEIGWFANNYLSLLETARVGARAGTVQEGDRTPESWEYRTKPTNPTGVWSEGVFLYEYSLIENAGGFPNWEAARQCGPEYLEELGFYNFLGCLILQSIQPLELRDDNGVDDMVISVFALQAIDPRPETDDFDPSDGIPPPLGDDVPQLIGGFLTDGTTPRPIGRHMVVVGRYPAAANECNVDENGAVVEFERDPFDYIHNNSVDARTISVDGVDIVVPLELVRFPDADPGNWNPYMDTGPEQQRGFVWLGQHKVGNCYGSDWTVARVENLFNLEALDLTAEGIDTDMDGIPDKRAQRANLPNQGLVLVELFWQHELLLKIPFFSPVFEVLGDRTTISVWAAFPVPSIEPKIRFR